MVWRCQSFRTVREKSSLRNPRVYLRILGVLQYMTQAQGFLNKLKQKDTLSNQLRRSATYRLSSGVPLCLWTVLLSGPYRCYTTLTFDTFSILIATSSLSIRFLRRNSLAAWLLPGFSVYSALGALPSWQSSEGLLKNDWLISEY